ncbi:DUF6596 domain-containing protein [Streptosporangium roseum]|uniref:DUF6596 domain-containing protein n=1 Tax=Streptosporangium roseum TaxID=2001 RepID=UPI0033300B9C
MAHRSLPNDDEVAGLLSLMLLTGRRAARTGPDGDLLPLAEQDRNRWDAAMIEEGAALVTGAMSASPLAGPTRPPPAPSACSRPPRPSSTRTGSAGPRAGRGKVHHRRERRRPGPRRPR